MKNRTGGSRPGREACRVATVEQQALEALFPYLACLLGRYAEPVHADPEKRLIFFAFLFGGISGLTMHLKMEPAQGHAVALALYQTGLQMTPDQSAWVAQHGIDATAAASPYNRAVHAGLDEIFAYLSNREAFIPTRLDPLLS